MVRYGYARVSTRSQTDDSQLDALRAAGRERIWTDTASGRLPRRPEWDKCLDYLRAGAGQMSTTWTITRADAGAAELRAGSGATVPAVHESFIR